METHELLTVTEKERGVRELQDLLQPPVESSGHPALNKLLERVIDVDYPSQAVAWCVTAGADPNHVVERETGQTLLHRAALKRPSASASILALLQAGASPTRATRDDKQTAWEILLEQYLVITTSFESEKYRAGLEKILDALFATRDFTADPSAPPVWWQAARHAHLPVLKRFHAAGVDLSSSPAPYAIFSAFSRPLLQQLTGDMTSRMFCQFKTEQHFHDQVECAQWIVKTGIAYPGEEVYRPALYHKNEPMARWLHDQWVGFPVDFVLFQEFHRPLPLTHYVMSRFHPSESMAQWLLSVIPVDDWFQSNRFEQTPLEFMEWESRNDATASLRFQAWSRRLKVLEEQSALTEQLASVLPGATPNRPRL